MVNLTGNAIKQQRLIENIYNKLQVDGLRYLPDFNLLKKVGSSHKCMHHFRPW